MKTVLATNPTFTPASKTLDFSGVTGFEIKRLIAVINVSRNAVIYAVGSANGYTAFANNILSLVFDTTTHNSADVLTCLYDSATNAVTADTLDALQAMTEVLESLATAMLRNQPQLDVNNRPMVRINTIDGGLTLGTLSTLNTFSGGNTAGIPYHLGLVPYLYDKIVTS